MKGYIMSGMRGKESLYPKPEAGKSYYYSMEHEVLRVTGSVMWTAPNEGIAPTNELKQIHSTSHQGCRVSVKRQKHGCHYLFALIFTCFRCFFKATKANRTQFTQLLFYCYRN